MIRVLFVDDEPKVLRGLERMLAGSDCEWEVAFAGGGREALELLAQRPFDVVVSDMRMPEMDGAALLEEVRRRHPDAARIVLSGYSERSLVLRSVAVAHRYLAKPCELDELRSVVTRAISLRRTLAEPRLRALVSQLGGLPSPPRVYRELVEQIQRPNGSLKELGAVVARDVGMSAKVLQIVNSAFFGMPRNIPDPVQAVCLIGLDVLRALVMTVHIFSELPAGDIEAFGLGSLWEHSAETGTLAKRIAQIEQCDRDTRDHAFMAGLLHDSGKLILASRQPERYRQALALAQPGDIDLLQAERMLFGTTHAEVGAYLLGLWGLPDLTIEAVAFHHHPVDCDSGAAMPVAAVHAANALEHALRRDQGDDPPPELDVEYLRKLGLAERWPVWRAECLAGVSR